MHELYLCSYCQDHNAHLHNIFDSILTYTTWQLTELASLCKIVLYESNPTKNALRKLNNKQRQVSMFLLKFLIHFPFVSFLSSLYSLSQSSLFSLSPIPSFSSDQFFVLIKTSSFITFCFINGIFFFAFCFTPRHIFLIMLSSYKLVKTNFDSMSKVWTTGMLVAGEGLPDKCAGAPTSSKVILRTEFQDHST